MSEVLVGKATGEQLIAVADKTQVIRCGNMTLLP